MSDKREEQKPEGEEVQHIQTEPKEQEEEGGKKGSGGLLSMVGDPIGTSFLSPFPPSFPLPSLFHFSFPPLPSFTQLTNAR
jgi:hypothetical protein